MIKRLITTTVVILFAFLILGVSLFKTSAQTDESRVATLEGEVLISDDQNQDQDLEAIEATKSFETDDQDNQNNQEKVNYYLPYPGILPDHPIYFLKMIRDRIELFLTTHPLKRAEKLLHYADKRIGAAKALIEGHKTDLGVTTLTKAEKYLERAVDQERKADEKGHETRLFLEKILLSSQKHEEILSDLREKAEGKEEIIDSLLDSSQKAQETISQRLKE